LIVTFEHKYVTGIIDSLAVGGGIMASDEVINCEICGAATSIDKFDMIFYNHEPFAFCEKCSSAIVYVDNEPHILIDALVAV
jgi:hypothetical protein